MTTNADREAAWAVRPNIYGEQDKARWMAGVYDAVPASRIQAFTLHRETSTSSLSAEVERLREALAAKPWPPSDDELRVMLGQIVGAWWSKATGQDLIEGKVRLSPQDIKGMYAVRDALAPYVAKAATNTNGEG